MKAKGFIYLASPYSHPDPGVVENRYQSVMAYTALLLIKKQWVYSPIVHCHEMAKKHKLPTDAAYWQDYNETMLRAADELYVLMLHKWQNSVGVRMELEFWENLGRTPIFVSLP